MALLAALLTGLLGGCAPDLSRANLPGQDAPVAAAGVRPPVHGYDYETLGSGGQVPDLFVIIAMSGGGKRSSAFSYGVLKGLRDTMVTVGGSEQTLLSNVDIISSVSGGSFTAAYYGVHRDGIFETYARDFLKRDIEAYIYGTFMLPWHWRWMVNPTWGTNDRMDGIYDRLLFRGATFADLERRGRPLIVLNATEISYGVPFGFTQSSFDMICSDLGRYRVARAVAASNGFPGIFAPVTLTSYSERCPNMRQAFAYRAEREELSRGALLREKRARLTDPDQTRYLHLMDGGIVDNLALRGILNTLITAQDDATRLERMKALLGVRRILVILADGQAINDGRRARERSVGGIRHIIGAVTGAQIDQYNLETLLLAQREFAEVARQIRRMRCRSAPRIAGHPCGDVQSFILRASIADVEDRELREHLQSVPTGLTLDDADVDALVAAGRQAILSSPTIREFLDSLR